MSGIVVCGLNGSGKSTFAKALAKQLSWEFVDIEDCFFPKEGQEISGTAPPVRGRKPQPCCSGGFGRRNTLCWQR